MSETLTDGLMRGRIEIPVDLRNEDLCVATVASEGYEDWIESLLGSLCANSQLESPLLAVFSYGDSAAVRRVAEKYEAVVIPCQSLRPLNVSCKAILYAAGHAIPADRFICIDADTLVLGDLRPIVAMIDASPPGSILACREGNWSANLGEAVTSVYGGSRDDIRTMLVGDSVLEEDYRFVVNDGVIAGSRAAFCGLENCIRGFSDAVAWVDDPIANVPWRNQFVFNLALAHINGGIELDGRFNVQLLTQRADFAIETLGCRAVSNGVSSSIVHFNGGTRGDHAEFQQRYSGISNPVVRTESRSDGYERFLDALRRWIGHLGKEALTWSFCGTSDGYSANVIDSSRFPLFATLHYLIRSSGCSRVIETGTARGVSAACIASAIAHRTNPAVVTIDIAEFPERESLWSELPMNIQECIVPRRVDALDGLRDAIVNGERFDAALLDTVHTEEHVLQEFQLATQLVQRGGLIIIHDAHLHNGTVAAALDRIQRQGYGVARLWAGEGRVLEDDNLGLAVIENRLLTASK